MTATYDPNIVGAIEVLVDLMSANGFTLVREPYDPNYRGLVDALLDLKEGFPLYIPHRVGFDAVAAENVTAGDVVYLRSSDGKAAKAIADGSSLDAAYAVGFVDKSKLAGETARIVVAGVQTLSASLDPGELYFLSATTAGAIELNPPATPGQYVTRVGEASTVHDFVVQLEPPIRLR